MSNNSARERKRPRIVAMDRGPSPDTYRLPSTTGFQGHDRSRAQSPAFSFGRKTKQFSSIGACNEASPGPIYFVHSRVTRTGSSGTATQSIHRKLPVRASTKSPGPAAYDVTNVPVIATYCPPAFSFGRRLDTCSTNHSNPSPAAYTLPSLIGNSSGNGRSSPSFTMAGKLTVGGFSDSLSQQTPGPGSYNTVKPLDPVKDEKSKQLTGFSMFGRTYPPGDQSKRPGPGAYSPEKVTVTHRRSPTYSFGRKHSEYVYTGLVSGN